MAWTTANGARVARVLAGTAEPGKRRDAITFATGHRRRVPERPGRCQLVDAALVPGPLGLAQHELLHLPGGCHRQRPEGNRVGALEVGGPLATEGDDLLLVGRGAVLEGHERFGTLAPGRGLTSCPSGPARPDPSAAPTPDGSRSRGGNGSQLCPLDDRDGVTHSIAELSPQWDVYVSLSGPISRPCHVCCS